MTAIKKRVSILNTPRAGNFKRNVINGIPYCVDCNLVIEDYLPGQGGKPMRCDKCKTVRNETIGVQRAAHSIVACAVRHGILKHPGDFECVDCGKQASVYDHRDYYKPLDVAPVCRSCNVIRGQAGTYKDSSNG